MHPRKRSFSFNHDPGRLLLFFSHFEPDKFVVVAPRAIGVHSYNLNLLSVPSSVKNATVSDKRPTKLQRISS